MADNTKIEWADATLNYVNGCSVLSPGCTNCYAMRAGGRNLPGYPSTGLTMPSKSGHVWTGEVRVHEPALMKALKWRKPRRIFWNAHGDLFHENVPDEWIDRLFAVCALTPQHTHMILTKRAGRMREYCTALAAGDRSVIHAGKGLAKPGVLADRMSELAKFNPACSHTGPLQNVMLGVSVEDQTRADERIPDLLTTPAAVRFISAEPLLGELNIRDHLPGHPAEGYCSTFTDRRGVRRSDFSGLPIFGLDWVIVGGESGPGARPMENEWAQAIVDQCRAASVPVFVKQLSSGGPKAIKNIEQFPLGLQVREYPDAR